MDLFGVIGKPIVHSRSPLLHNAAFEALGMQARYLRIASQDAAGALLTAGRLGVEGLNVTSPYKAMAAQLAEEQDAISQDLGAANTLLWRGGKWHAHNTDVGGVRGALRRHDVRLKDADALVLGAGGAAMAAAMALHLEGANVTVAARDPMRARAVANVVGGAACSLIDAAGPASAARVIVSAVSTDEPVLDPDSLRPGTVVLDARYQSEGALVREARRRGCVIIDGREWLLCQAADAFKLFTGRKAPFVAMEEAVSQEPAGRGAMISLIGFMGCGKTSAARLVGSRLGLPVFRTDSLVEQHAGMPVDRLLRERGEPALRDWECKVLEALPDSPGVLDCGGGLITTPQGRQMLRAKSRVVVWLWASPETCLARIGDTSSRPLLEPSPETTAPRLLRQRIGSYASASDVVVDTEDSSLEEVANLASAQWRDCL